MGEVLVTSPVAGGAPVMPELTMRSEDKVIDGGGDGGGSSGGGGGGGGDSPSPTTNGNTVVRWEKFLPKMILRVLLVEADDSTRQIITALLRKCSYKVAAVSDGLKAWEVLKGRSHNIDLILTEVELPSISGFALLTLIMEHQICKNIPVIMMSAHDSVSTVYKCMLRGAADFLVKPVRKNELKNLWQHVWRRQASTAVSNGHQEESSCTKPDIEPNGPPVENPNDLTGSQQANRSRNRENEPEGSEKDELQEKPDTSAREKNIAIDIDTSREAIALIRSFDSYPKASYKSSLNHGVNKVDHPSPMLDLSLRRSLLSSSVNQFSDGRHGLKHSDASAFSRYINKNHPPVTSVSASISNSDKLLSKNPVEYISDTHNPIGHHGLAESQSQFPSPKERQFPVRGLRFDNPGGMYNPTLPGPFCVQSCLAHVQSPCSSGHHEPFRFQENPYAEGDTGMETVEDRGHVSSATDHSPGSSLCNGGMLAHFDSGGSGSNGHVNLVVDGNNGHRSIQREAALNKFRMKRKDRCFEKKVRYESRKKLAEQRPRVKGQFVRQGQTNIPSPNTELGATKTMA